LLRPNYPIWICFGRHLLDGRIRHAEIGLQCFFDVDQPLKTERLNGANNGRIGRVGLATDFQRRFAEDGMAMAAAQHDK